jgi:hypothetical protein
MAKTPPTVAKALTERLTNVKEQAQPVVDKSQMTGPVGKTSIASAGVASLPVSSSRRTPTERAAVTANYVHDQNIQRFVQMLREESDPHKRAVIERLLAEERANTPSAGVTAGPGKPKKPKT